MSVVKKQEVAIRLSQIIENKFGGVLRQYALSAKMTAPTLKNYVDGSSIPGGENLLRLAEAGKVTTDWILKGPEKGARLEAQLECYTPEEKEVIREYRAASQNGRETGRMVFRMNRRDEKKTEHPLRRRTDFAGENAG